MNKLFSAILCAILMYSPISLAGHDHSHEIATQGDFQGEAPQKNEAIIQVQGVVCSFCSLGIQKKLSKLSFIDTSKFNNGSIMNIENQEVKIAFKDKTSLDILKIYQTILDGGYEPIKTLLNDGETIYLYDKDGKLCDDTHTC